MGRGSPTDDAVWVKVWSEIHARASSSTLLAFTTTGTLTADVVLAHCIGVCGEVFRRISDSQLA